MQYCYNPLCKNNLNYCVAYSFLFVFNLFGFFLIIYNSFNLDYGEDENSLKFLFSVFWIFISFGLSRLFCIIKEKKDIPGGNILLFQDI